MSQFGFVPKRPTQESFSQGVALHDIYDNEGIKWIAKGQKLNKVQIETALAKGSLTKRDADKPLLAGKLQPKTELKPTFQDISELSEKIEIMHEARDEELAQKRRLSQRTLKLILDSSESLLDLMHSNRFSPYKLTGLTNFLYGEAQFQHRREQLKTLNNSGTQFTLFQGIVNHGLKDIVIANLLNPSGFVQKLVPKPKQADAPNRISSEHYRDYCQQAAQTLIDAVQKTPLGTSVTMDMLRYFSPWLYFTSAEARLSQQINIYLNFLMPDTYQEAMPFKLSNVPIINFSQYFKSHPKSGGLGLEGARIVQYVGLIPPGTAVQFTNREKGLIIAPKNKDVLYCVILTGMDGQPLITPSLREIHFKDLNRVYKIIPSHDLPLKYETHSHEKIWKMHIVHENLKKLEV
jgi:hypothetical protein